MAAAKATKAICERKITAFSSMEMGAYPREEITPNHGTHKCLETILLLSRSFGPRSAHLFMRKNLFLAFLLSHSLAAAADSQPTDHAAKLKEGRELFESAIRPALVETCLKCHGDGKELEGFDKQTCFFANAVGPLMKSPFEFTPRGQHGKMVSSIFPKLGEQIDKMAFIHSGYTESKKPGRDHNPHCFTTWMAGGGIKGGVSFGESDEIGHPAARDKSHVNDIQANILHQLGFNHEKLTYEYNGRRFRLTDVGDKVITPSLT